MHLKSYTSISMLVKKKKKFMRITCTVRILTLIVMIFFFFLGAVHSIGIWWKFQSVWHVIKLWAFLVLLVKIILENIVFHPYRYRPLLLSWHKPCEWYVHGMCMVSTIIFYVITFLCISKTVHDLNICSQLNTSLSLSLYIYIYVCMYMYLMTRLPFTGYI